MPGEQQLLIAFDGSPSAEAAIGAAARFFRGAHARVLSVYAPLVSFEQVLLAGAAPTPEMTARVDELVREASAEARSVAEEGARRATDLGLQAQPIATEARLHAWQAIVAEGDAHRVALVVAGSRGRGAFARALLGSTSTGLLHHATRPLLVVPEGEGASEGPVLLAYDGSDGADAAVGVAGRLLAGHSIVVLHVWESPIRHTLTGKALAAARVDEIRGIVDDFDQVLADRAAATTEEGVARARGAGLNATGAALESSARVWQTIGSAAEERGASLLVVGSRGTGRAASALLGSVSAGLVHNVQMPTLVVPGP